jgi:hypothetical protein
MMQAPHFIHSHHQENAEALCNFRKNMIFEGNLGDLKECNVSNFVISTTAALCIAHTT